MAAVIAMMARDREGPSVHFQLLICPATNLAETDTLSYQQFGFGLWVPEELMQWYTNHYLKSQEDIRDFYVSPLLANNLSGLPPAFIVIAEFDILRDEAESYGKRLQESGVHGYENLPGPDPRLRHLRQGDVKSRRGAGGLLQSAEGKGDVRRKT